MNANALEISVEDVLPGQKILVSRRIGFRTVREVREYDTLGLEQVRCFVVIYEAGAGLAWENRSGMKGVASVDRRRTVQGLRPLRRGEPVQIERLHLVERS